MSTKWGQGSGPRPGSEALRPVQCVCVKCTREAGTRAQARRPLDGPGHGAHGRPAGSWEPRDETGLHRTDGHSDRNGGWQGTKRGSFQQGVAITG